MEINNMRESKKLKETVDKYFEYVIKFYGDKYENLIIDTIKSTYFYHMNSNENMFDVLCSCYSIINNIAELSDENKEFFRKISNELIYNPSFAFKSEDNSKNIIIINGTYSFSDIYLIHELYSHCISSQVNNDSNGYFRSGFRFSNSNGMYYNFINEGFSELFARYIYEMSGKIVSGEYAKNVYLYPTYAASIIYDGMDKETIRDSYVIGNPHILDIFKKRKLNKLEKILITEDKTGEISNSNIFNNLLRSVNKEKIITRR